MSNNKVTNSFLRKHGLLLAIAIMFLGYCGGSLIYTAYGSIITNFGWKIDVESEWVGMTVKFTVFLIILLIAKYFGIYPKIKWGFKRTYIGLIAGAYIVIYSLVSLYCCHMIYNMNGIRPIWSQYFTELLYYMFVGLEEEFWFRGVVYTIFKSKFPKTNRLYLIAGQAICFGLFHSFNYFAGYLPLAYSIKQVIIATAIGFIMGLSYELSGSLVSVIFMHGFYDFVLIAPFCFEGAAKYVYPKGAVEYTLMILISLVIQAFAITLWQIVEIRKEESKREKTKANAVI